jgi:GH15 family glucan-1,4-alpha-glucosidase
MKDDIIMELVDSSKDILLDCCLENGAIVAANSMKESYSKEAKNYFYVWPRDGSYSCIALDILGVTDVQEKFFDWLMKRAGGWNETGLFYEKYYVNGPQALSHFQPDQTGIVLYAVSHHFTPAGKIPDKYKDLVIKSANGICNNWVNNHLKDITNDVWEERLCFPDLEENFTYSIAACYAGLVEANKFFPNEIYTKTSAEMKDEIIKHSKNNLIRSFGKLDDERIDASLLGVMWPFNVISPTDDLALNTVKEIEQKIVKDFGVHRYEQDEYDGWMLDTLHRKKGAGYWPLLNFWMAIVLNRIGQTDKAIQYFNKGLPKNGVNIPEQVFNNDIQKAVSPLCWSHSMFIIAAEELGLYKFL